MIKDRNTKKWTAIMLPEHVQCLKEALIDEHKIEQPELDEQAIENFELIICEAMESNKFLNIEVYEHGFTKIINGTVHYINSMKSQIVIQDKEDFFHYIPFNSIVNIQPE